MSIVNLVTLVAGLLSRINVDTCETRFGPMVVAFKARTGPYKGAGRGYTNQSNSQNQELLDLAIINDL